MEDLEKIGETIRAIFKARDFTPRAGLTYNAALFRTVGTVTTKLMELTSFINATVNVDDNTVTVKRADFDISGLSAGQRTGTFTVAVSACTDGTPSRCGAYGSHGSILLILE